MSKSQTKKSKASAKKQKEKERRRVATRASVRLNPTADADNPRASSSNSMTSGGQALGSNPSYTFGSIPSNNQNFVTPVNGPVRVASSVLSSLNTLTPSPVAIPVARSPFMTPTTLTGDPGFTDDREGNGPDHNTNQYTFIPGLGFMYRAEGQEPPATITETDFPNIIQSNIVDEGNDGPETSSAQMSERERALRRAEKSKHHGAASVGEDDIETPEIQQAILDNLPLKDPDPIPSTEEESRSFLPTAASTELNTLFNRAVNLITSSLGPSVGQPQTDAIANTAGNHFAANLQSAVARLMSPRRENETDEQYASRINAQFRFVNGNANRPYQEEHSNSESRSNVHFSPSTSGGSVIRDTDHRRDARDGNTNGSQRPDHSRSSRTNSIEHIEDPVARANREFKDRVAVQRMRNADMRQSGQSPYPDQNISFDDAGNPFNRNNLPVQPTTGSYTQNPNTGRALGPHELERNGTGNIRYDQHTEGGTNTIRTFDYRVPQYPPITEISETNSSEMTDFRRYKGDSSDYTEPSDEYSSDSNSETSSELSRDDKKRDKRREKRRRRNEKEKSLRKEWKRMGSGGSDDSGDGSGTDKSSSDTSTYSSSSTSTARRERNRQRRRRLRQDPEWRDENRGRRQRYRGRIRDNRRAYQREMKQRIFRLCKRSVGHRTDLGLSKSIKLETPKKFNGRGDARAFEEWLPELLRFMSLSGLNGDLRDPARVRMLGVCLEGEALTWYNATIEPMYAGAFIPRRRWRFDEAVWELYRQFVHDHALNNANRDFESASWRPSSGINGLYYDLTYADSHAE
ncbi:hypothetical protein C8J56DRAFT_1039813 [Mycena floridula]|nr:hypothetical protein C8J56DRAFT_1039813 [Mycena floridula]